MREALDADIAIVGGGPAGAALAIRLANAGREVTLFERTHEPKWRACGVFSSPLARRRLVELGLSAAETHSLARPISALRLETLGAASCRIEYEHGYACGFDRVRLDRRLLDAARAAGARVRTGTVVRSVQLPMPHGRAARIHVSSTTVGEELEAQTFSARLVVGADGPRSVVARDAGVHLGPSLLPRKAAITFHRNDPAAGADNTPMEGRFVFGQGWYVGVAPVPAGRVNLGLVVPAGWLSDALPELSDRLIDQFPGPREAWMSAPITDGHRAAGMLEHRVSRASGPGYLLIGDAAGFIDPLTGEGLHRALVSAELAEDSITRWLRGDPNAIADYDRRVRSRWQSKNLVSWILQAFLARPAALDYALRRLAARHELRRQLTLVLTDQARATKVLDPRYLGRLLLP